MLLDLFLNGIVQGSLLALIAIGYSLAYGSARVINFAHADVMIAGGGYLVLLWLSGTYAPDYTSIIMSALFGAGACFASLTWLSGRIWRRRGVALGAGGCVAWLSYLLAGKLPFALAALIAVPWSALLATAIFRIGYLPLLRKSAPRTSILLAALGMSIALQSVLLIAWGSQRRVFAPRQLPPVLVVASSPDGVEGSRGLISGGVLRFMGDTGLPVHDVAIILTFCLVTASLILFFRFSRTADAIIAAADAPLAARACGVSVERMLSYAFLLGGAIASLGGTLYILRAKSLDPMAGFAPGILAFAACVLGGIGSLRGSIAGAFITSMVISFAPAVPLDEWAASGLPDGWLRAMPSMNLSDWSYGVIYVLMIIIILFKPQGLFER